MIPSLRRRTAARALDFVLLGALGAAWGYPFAYGFVWLGVHALVVYLYFAIGDAFFGRTLGKAALGLRVAGAGGAPRATLGQALAREAFVILGAVPFVGPLLALTSWIAIAVTAKQSELGQGFHDRLAGGTRVTTLQ